MESLILSSPLALFFYGAALGLNLFDRLYHASSGWLTIVSTLICLGATAYSLMLGASLWECATALLVFLLVNMGVEE